MSAVQGELLPEPVGAVGELEKAARRTIKAAQLEEVDAAGAQLVVDLAACLDRAKRAPKLYVVAPLVQQFRELLAELKLTPASRGGGTDPDDPFDKLVRELADAGTGTAVRHTS